MEAPGSQGFSNGGLEAATVVAVSEAHGHPDANVVVDAVTQAAVDAVAQSVPQVSPTDNVDPTTAAAAAAAAAAVDSTSVAVAAAAAAAAAGAETRDIVHEFLAEVRRGAPHDARRYHEASEVAFSRKPATLQQSLDGLELARLSNAQCKVMLSVMNVTGCKNSCLAAKKYILACKMVQRQVALQALFDILSRQNLVQAHEQRADGGTSDQEVARIKSLPKTSASADPARPGQHLTDFVNWARGDIPVFIGNNEVIVGEPPLDGTQSIIPPSVIDPAIPVDGGDTKPDLKRRAPSHRRSADNDERAFRRRRTGSNDLTAPASPNGDADVYVKEAEAQAASARAVSDTLKAIKETESMMAGCDPEDEAGRAFYKSVITTLRQKMAGILGLPLPR